MKTHNFIKNQNGVALVEFGLILPLLILLLFGITEFSLLLYNKQVITNAAREGARAGIIIANYSIYEKNESDTFDFLPRFTVSVARGKNLLPRNNFHWIPLRNQLLHGVF